MSVEFSSLDDLAIESKLPLRDLDDAFFHCSGRDETEYSNLFLLADTMRSICESDELSFAGRNSATHARPTCLELASLREGCSRSRNYKA